MRALIKKELSELLLPSVLLFAILAWAWIGLGTAEKVLLEVRLDPTGCILGTALVLGVTFGFLQFAQERWKGTLGFLVHREHGHRGVFLAKALTGIGATLFVTLGPLLVFALWHALSSPIAPVLQWQRVAALAIVSVCGAGGYAAGALAAQLHRALLHVVALALFGCMGMLSITLLLLIPTGLSLTAASLRYASVELAIAAVLLALASKLFRGSRDPDLALPRGQYAALLAIAIFLYASPCGTLVDMVQSAAQTGLLNSHPMIVRERTSGEIFTAAELDDGRVFKLDDQGRFAEDKPRYNAHLVNATDDVHDVLYHPILYTPDEGRLVSSLQGIAFRTFPLGPRWTEIWRSSRSINAGDVEPFNDVRVYMDYDAGVVRAFWLWRSWPSYWLGSGQVEHFDTAIHRVPTRPMPFELVLEKPEGNHRFSLRTMTTSYFTDGARQCFVDTEDGTIWQADFDDPAASMQRVPLPGDDRFVKLESLYSRRNLRAGRHIQNYLVPLIVGEKGRYAWNGSAVVAWTPELKGFEDMVPASEAEPLITVRTVVIDPDPVAMRVEVREAGSDKLLFTHQYGPRSVYAHVMSAIVDGTSLLRSPLVVSSLLWNHYHAGDGSAGNTIEVGTGFFLGRVLSIWTVLNLAAAATCVVLIVMRLRRRDAGLLAIVLAASIVAAFGVPAYVVVRWLEPECAKATPQVAQTSLAREILIQSA